MGRRSRDDPMSQPTLRIGTSRRALTRRPLGVLLIIGFVFAIGLILFGLVGDFIVDWLWFSELGYFGVFWTSFLAQTQVFGVVFAVSAIILWLNGAIALRLASKPAGAPPQHFNFATAAELAEYLAHWRFLPRA